MKTENATAILTGRFVHADDMGTTPCSSTKDNLHLLTTRKTAHGVMRDKLRLQAKVRKVALDLTTNERAEESKTLSLLGVDLDNLLLETTLDELITRQPQVLSGAHSLEANFVLVALLQLLPGDNLLNEALLALKEVKRARLASSSAPQR